MGICTFAILFSTRSLPPVYDEPPYFSAGMRYAGWIGETFRHWKHGDFALPLKDNFIQQYWSLSAQHPAFAKVVSGIFAHLTGEPRLGIILLASIGSILLYQLIAPGYGILAGIIAAMTPLGMPRLFYHLHLTTLDGPVAVMWFLTIFAFWQFLARPSFSRTVTLGVVYGLALATKLNAFFIPFILFTWVLLYQRKQILKLALALLTIAPGIFYLTWPYLWHHPINCFMEYILFHLYQSRCNVYYFGGCYYNSAPWHYPFIITISTIPLIVGGLVIAGISSIRKDKLTRFLLFNILFILMVHSLPPVPKYNGERLFLPVFYLIAPLAGIGFTSCLKFLNRKWIAPLFAVTIFILYIYANLSVYPFGLSYYGGFVGGIRGARNLGLETSYWGEAVTAVVPFVNKNAPLGNTIAIANPPPLISGESIPICAPYFRKDLHIVKFSPRRKYDWLVLDARQAFFDDLLWKLYREGTPLYSYKISGVNLACVFERKEVARVKCVRVSECCSDGKLKIKHFFKKVGSFRKKLTP